MATVRGITETKVYDREGVIDRYGIPPELIPDFYRPQGRHLGQHPRRPRDRRQDRRPAAPAVRRRSRRCSTHVDEISGAKRKENLTRPRRRRAHLEAAGDDARATSTVDFDVADGRRAPSPTARACARSSASSSCATRCAASRRRCGEDDAAAPRAGAPSDARPRPRARGHASPTSPRPDGAIALRRARARGARGRSCSPRRSRWRFAAFAGGAEVLVGRRRRARARRSSRRPATAASSAHDAKALRRRCRATPRPRHDGRRLPARSRAPRLPARELAEERGLGADVDDDADRRATRSLIARARGPPARAARRARASTGAARRGRAAARATCCARWSARA